MEKAENEVEELVETPAVEETEGEEGAEVEQEGEQPEGEAEATESDEVTVSLGEESPASEDEQHAPDWVRELRKEAREKSRRIRELEAKLQEVHKPAGPMAPGPKPTLEGCEFDAEKYEADLEAWHARKRAYEDAERAKLDAQKQEQEQWQARLQTYTKLKTELRVSDYADAEEVARDALDVTQQGIILSGAANPALIVYAIGKNPRKAAELAAIKDPVQFAFAVAKLETQLKVTPRKNVPPPEKKVVGSTAVSGSDAVLAKLEAEADRTGDRTKVIAYKRSLKKAS